MIDTMRELNVDELESVGAGHGTTNPPPPPPPPPSPSNPPRQTNILIYLDPCVQTSSCHLPPPSIQRD
jgi:hypothetical protein